MRKKAAEEVEWRRDDEVNRLPLADPMRSRNKAIIHTHNAFPSLPLQTREMGKQGLKFTLASPKRKQLSKLGCSGEFRRFTLLAHGENAVSVYIGEKKFSSVRPSIGARRRGMWSRVSSFSLSFWLLGGRGSTLF